MGVTGHNYLCRLPACSCALASRRPGRVRLDVAGTQGSLLVCSLVRNTLVFDLFEISRLGRFCRVWSEAEDTFAGHRLRRDTSPVALRCIEYCYFRLLLQSCFEKLACVLGALLQDWSRPDPSRPAQVRVARNSVDGRVALRMEELLQAHD